MPLQCIFIFCYILHIDNNRQKPGEDEKLLALTDGTNGYNGCISELCYIGYRGEYECVVFERLQLYK